MKANTGQGTTLRNATYKMNSSKTNYIPKIQERNREIISSLTLTTEKPYKNPEATHKTCTCQTAKPDHKKIQNQKIKNGELVIASIELSHLMHKKPTRTLRKSIQACKSDHKSFKAQYTTASK